jgi:hypothetical protein
MTIVDQKIQDREGVHIDWGSPSFHSRIRTRRASDAPCGPARRTTRSVCGPIDQVTAGFTSCKPNESVWREVTGNRDSAQDSLQTPERGGRRDDETWLKRWAERDSRRNIEHPTSEHPTSNPTLHAPRSTLHAPRSTLHAPRSKLQAPLASPESRPNKKGPVAGNGTLRIDDRTTGT